MNIRFSSPVIFTNDGAKVIAQMEAIGFRKQHVKEKISGSPVSSTTMKNENGHPLCIVEGEGFTTTFSGIRLNVDNVEEALEQFLAMGYVNLQPGITNTGSSFATLLRSPEGVFVSLAQHFE